ncbi:hypothetical protein C8Q76DRAFT_483359 [Earliella scabrosa]|nr:hypothetical protein C8Q76DRAFT_483359 [Earliella scabrosa]
MSDLSSHSSPEPSSPNPSTPSSDPAIRTSYASLDDQLERLTNAIQQVGEGIQQCNGASDDRHARKLAREEEERRRTTSVQDQLAQMLAMTQQSLRRNQPNGDDSGQGAGAVPAAPSSTFSRDLQRAAFGAGGTPETASRSSMLEERESSG